LYEAVFEPLSVAFARQAIARLDLAPGERVLDVAAGAGGAALIMAEAGAAVTAIDGSPAMVERMRARARQCQLPLDARLMDGMVLDYPDEAFDAALSVFGVILFPDPVKGLSEIRRVVGHGGRIAVVTWTEPHRYELATMLREAIQSLGPEPPQSAPLPAQLRFVEPNAFRRLFAEAGIVKVEIETAEARIQVPAARWLAERIQFAPGMAAWMSSLGGRRETVLDALVRRLEHDQGTGEISLGAVAAIGTVRIA
jgi:ubiquinone/menaquinone biosynthesis C-methylase UbiE